MAAQLSKPSFATPSLATTDVLELTPDQAERLRKDLPDLIVIPDRNLNLIRPERTGASTAKAKIAAKDLWHLKTIGVLDGRGKRKTGFTGKGVTIAVLDTGVDGSHPEFAGKNLSAVTFDVDQWQSIPQADSVDSDGHGTHVAGLAAGKTVGVAPAANIISALVIPNGSGTLSSFLLALEWAAMQPEVQIINLSAGFPGYLPEMHSVVADLLAVGVLPVIAIGNEGRNRTRSPGNYGEVLSVGATNRDDNVSSFSSSGTMVVDNHLYPVPSIVAPGEAVYSAVPGGTYEAWSGTSMAAPVVAGAAALLVQEHPNLAVMDLVDEILARADHNEYEYDDRQGHGILNINE